MKKLRLSSSEWEEMLKDISDKFHNDCNRSLSDFEYSQKDINNFLNNMISENQITAPTIEITADAYTAMYELVKQSSVEIQWHGLVEKLEDNKYRIYDILVFPQTNSSASTTSDQDEFAEWQTKLIMDPNFPIERMRLHGHSHVNMTVYSSAIDDGYQSELITKVDDGDFYIFLVLNKRMEMYPLLYDFDQQILFEGNDIDIKITNIMGGDIKTWAANEIQKNCKTQHKTYSSYPSGYAVTKKTNFEIEKKQNALSQAIADIAKSPNFAKRRK